ncbi:MAG: universal stress protein [Christiangramia sp.]
MDLFIVPTHGRRGLAHFFYGSAGENIANNSQVSVLTIKIPS